MEIGDVNMDPMTLVEALKRLADERDDAAWAVLLKTTAAEVVQLARSMTCDSALADDVAQEVLLQIRDHARSFSPMGADPEVCARNWIRRIACFTCLRMMRDQRRARRRDLRQSEQFLTPMTHETPETIAIKTETVALLQREVAALPEKNRLSLLLHYYGGLSDQEISVELDCPSATVKTHRHRGLEKLRARLAVCGVALPAIEITEQLRAPMAGTFLPGAEQLLQMQTLLHGTQSAAAYGVGAAAKGGMSIMAKSALGAAVAAVVAAAAITVQGVWSAEEPKPAAAPDAPAVVAPAPAATPDAMEAKAPIVKIPELPAGRDSAQILAIRPDVQLIMLSAGSEQGVSGEEKWIVHRRGKVIAEVQVEKVYPDMSSARVMRQFDSEDIQVHDLLRSTGVNGDPADRLAMMQKLHREVVAPRERVAPVSDELENVRRELKAIADRLAPLPEEEKEAPALPNAAPADPDRKALVENLRKDIEALRRRLQRDTKAPDAPRIPETPGDF
jgi:RNA polymerase sigma factor (sigma-70 family)